MTEKGDYLIHGLFDVETSEEFKELQELFADLDRRIDEILPPNGDKQIALVRLQDSWMWVSRCLRIRQAKKNIENLKD